MSFAATHDAKEQVRQAIDIVALVGAYIPLRRQGRIYVGQCPWHDDARPSLQVNPERQSWKCWVCDLGGDIFSFVMQRERVDFREALELLADQAGVTLTTAAPQGRGGDANDKKMLLAAMAWAERVYAECLLHSTAAEGARQYLRDRKLEPRMWQQFHLGFAPDDWGWLQEQARATSYSPAVLEAAGLLGKSSSSGRLYDRFKGRVLFPIRDTQNRPIALGGRVLPELANDKTAKYINSPETRLFSKSENLYGLDQARDAISRSRRAIVMEGYTDVIMAHQHGLHEAVAVLGTALGPRHIQLLRRYADTVVLVLDGDEAGQRRANEVLELFVASEVDVRILTLPSGLDPCDFLLERGAEAMQEALQSADDVFEHAVRCQLHGFDPVRDTHRANQALEHLLAILAKAPRLSSETTSARMVRERQVLSRLAREFRVEEQALRRRLQELRGAAAARVVPPDDSRSQPAHFRDLKPFEAELLEILVRHPATVDTAMAALHENQLESEPARRLLAHYRQLADNGESCDFEVVMTSLDDPHLKNLLVELDERSARKEPLAQEDAAARLRQLLEDIRYRSEEPSSRDQLAALEQRRVTEQEELTILQDLLERERKRQGIPAPTDG